MITCPQCEGKKQVEVLLHYANRPCEMATVNCFTCKGEGQITEEHQVRIEKGLAMRADRLKRGLSQREEAVRLGMSPQEYSKLEHGQEAK